MKKLIKVSEINPNDENPRYISKDKFQKLVKSIKDFPEMLEKRPLVVDENMIVLGGNMRLKALKEAGIKETYVDIAEGWTDEQKKEFIIKDNVGFGEWDWDILANEWNIDELENWGLDVPKINDYEEIEPSGYDLQQKWFLNIEFETEEDCEKWYNSLMEEGLICKIVQ